MSTTLQPTVVNVEVRRDRFMHVRVLRRHEDAVPRAINKRIARRRRDQDRAEVAHLEPQRLRLRAEPKGLAVALRAVKHIRAIPASVRQ